MSLLFGKLTLQFVNFQTVINQANQGDEQASQNIPVAAAAFRKVAAQDASYLVAIGRYKSDTLELNADASGFA